MDVLALSRPPFLALLASLLLAALPAKAADRTLLLDVYVNGYSIGTIGEFVQRDDDLLARRSELTSLGLQSPPSSSGQTDDLVTLASLPGVTWKIDNAKQAIYFTAADDRRLPKRLAAGQGPVGEISIQSGAGLTLNYDVRGTMTGDEKALGGLFDIRGYSMWGVANSGFLVRAGSGSAYAGGATVIRLDTAAEYSDVDSLRRYTVGDFVSEGLSWTRPVRLAGAKIRSDFSMRPDLVTFPLPTLSGAAAVPSTLDVFANNVRLLSTHVEPGPFEVPQMPVISGAGTVSMTLTNALGNQVNATMPFYVSPALLSNGLQTFSLQGGFVRHYYGLVSEDYGDLATSAFYRRGLTDELTFEAAAEGTSGMYMAGGGLNWNAFDWAVIDAATSISHGLNRTGTQIALGIQHLGIDFSYSGTAVFADRNYLDIAAMNGDPVPRLQLTGTFGISLGSFGSLGIAYARIDRPDMSLAIALPAPGDSSRATAATDLLGPARPARLLSASYSIQIENISLYATTYHNFSNDNDDGIFLGLTIPLGSRGSASASAGGSAAGGFGQLQAQQSMSSIGDWGYQAYAAQGGEEHEFGQVQYKSRYSLYSAGVDHSGDSTQGEVEAQGAFSLVEWTPFGSNPIPDSFALVKTSGLKDIHVLLENRDAGTTNYRGMLVVPDLRSFEINHIAIDPNDIPPDMAVETTTREVRPQDRSGVVVLFSLKASHGALIRIVDEAGSPIRVGSRATLSATGTAVPVGYDGAVYVENLAPHNAMVVERPDGQRCNVTFDYTAVRGEIPKIGPLACRKAGP